MNTLAANSINPVMIDGKEVTIRPIKHDDTVLEEEFINGLSDQAKRYRFFAGIHQLSGAAIQQLCDVDYHDSMAFVATISVDGKENEVGVARYIKNENLGSHECALTVADEYRGSPLGRTLVEYLIAYGRKHGVKSIYTVEFNDNADMRKLANDLNMSVRLDPNDAHQVIYSLSIDEHPETITF